MLIGYVRVSTAEQNTARQEDLMKSLGVEKIFIDRLSGKNTDRPMLKDMLDYIRDGDTVIVESYSRLARSTTDLFNLIDHMEQKGVQFISQKEQIDTRTPQGRLMLTIFAGLAQFERENLLQRQREGIEIAKAEGKYKGRPPADIPEFEDYYKLWQDKKITATAVCRNLGISRATFYRRVKILEDMEYIDF